MKTNNKAVLVAGCGKGKSCRIGLYVQPYSSTRDQFSKYADDAIKRLKEDNKK